MARQAVADLGMYINNLQSQLKKLASALRRRRNNLNELRKYVEKRQEQLMRYGFDERLRLPYFLAETECKNSGVAYTDSEESKRVLETRTLMPRP